jgi:CheY-like chemotaxis protein
MIKILAVDDEQGICNLIKDAFAPIGFTVLSANNGQDALRIVNKEKPRLVFLDIRMMGMSGLEVLREIKTIDRTIKVVMLTVMADEATKRKAKELGADDFVTKPFMSEHLEEVARKEIAELMKERQIEKPKILVVDDEEDVRTRLVNLIARHFSCEVDKAANGQEALQKLKNNKFDLVVMDIKMPGLSGIDVIREAIKFTPQTQFLAISGYDSNEVADEALRAGAVDFIHKPQTVGGIERKVKDILKKIGKYTPKKV